MNTISQEIEKHIKKLVNPLLNEEELEKVLKVKLTKKELKLLQAWTAEIDTKEICTNLNLNEERYSELSSKLIKKLNQERIKQAISQ